MRIRKYVLFIFCACLILCFNVSAHPGKTDSNSGHIDYDTGEYHYHHGYPEHDHYDMDGDGDVDCPYDFDDQSSHNGLGNKSNITELESSIKPTFSNVLLAMLKCLIPAILLSAGISHLLYYLFAIFFGKDRGCSVAFILFAILFVIVYILSIINSIRR